MSNSYEKKAQALEESLGSPFDDENVFSFSKIMLADESENFPEATCARYDELELQKCFIPVAHGGSLINYDQIIEIVKILGRRDMTTLIAKGKNFLGSLPIFLFGDIQQKEKVAESLNHFEYTALALTENGSGSDLLSTNLTAVKSGEAWTLNGKKWLINNIARARYICTLSRINPVIGPRSLSLLLVDRHKKISGQLNDGEKIYTLGVRGMDMGSLTFTDAKFDDIGPIGGLDRGFEVTGKTLQVSRIVCSALTLGAFDCALRIVGEYLVRRKLYGKAADDIIYVRHRMAEAYTNFLLVDILSYALTRSIHLIPQELSVLSAFAKFYIPSVADETLSELSRSYGARYFLREGFVAGMFQKQMRDIALVALFDGSSQVNLTLLTSQLFAICEPQPLTAEEMIVSENIIRAIFNLDRPLEPVDSQGLLLSSRGRNIFFSTISILQNKCEKSGLKKEFERLKKALFHFEERMKEHKTNFGIVAHPHLHKLAKDFCELLALIFALWNQIEGKGVSQEAFELIQLKILSSLGEKVISTDPFEMVYEEFKSHLVLDRNFGVIKYDLAPWFQSSKDIDFV